MILKDTVRLENSIKGLKLALTMALDRIEIFEDIKNKEIAPLILIREELVKVIVDKELLLRSISK